MESVGTGMDSSPPPKSGTLLCFLIACLVLIVFCCAVAAGPVCPMLLKWHYAAPHGEREFRLPRYEGRIPQWEVSTLRDFKNTTCQLRKHQLELRQHYIVQ